MRPNPAYESTNPEVVRDLIRKNPWAILVSTGSDAPVASHAPILLEEGTGELAVVTHLGKPDDELHDFGERQVLLIVQGAHGYVSTSWYAAQTPGVPTWNYSVAHCYGVPELLSEERNLAELSRLVEHFERHVEHPAWLDLEYGAGVARGTVGIRVPIARFVCKRKLSQNRDAPTRDLVIAALRAPGPYANPELAWDMERAALELSEQSEPR
jgi:transcriptional regulator